MQNERHIGKKYYELTNHLGNVLAVVSDFKRGQDDFGYDNTGGFPSDYIYEAVPGTNEWGIVKDVSYGALRRTTGADGVYDYYEPDVVSYSDYYPFGMQMPGRKANTSAYSMGFQGQLKDDEIKGEGNSLNYEYRMHDPRIGRFFAVDPLAAAFAYNSPYAFSENRVIDSRELEGLEKVPANEVWNMNQSGVSASGVPQSAYGTPGKWGQIDGQNVMLHEITEGPNKGNYVGTIYYDDKPGHYEHSAYIVGKDLVVNGPFYGELTSTTSSEDLNQAIAWNKADGTVISWDSYEHIESTDALWGLIENEGQQAYNIKYETIQKTGWDADGNQTLSFDYNVIDITPTWSSHSLNLGVYTAGLTTLSALQILKAAKTTTVDDLIKLNGGKNSVTIETATQKIRYDLAGKAHGGVATPHMQVYNKNFVNGVQKSVTRANKNAIPMTQQDLEMIKKYLKGK